MTSSCNFGARYLFSYVYGRVSGVFDAAWSSERASSCNDCNAIDFHHRRRRKDRSSVLCRLREAARSEPGCEGPHVQRCESASRRCKVLICVLDLKDNVIQALTAPICCTGA